MIIALSLCEHHASLTIKEHDIWELQWLVCHALRECRSGRSDFNGWYIYRHRGLNRAAGLPRGVRMGASIDPTFSLKPRHAISHAACCLMCVMQTRLSFLYLGLPVRPGQIYSGQYSIRHVSFISPGRSIIASGEGKWHRCCLQWLAFKDGQQAPEFPSACQPSAGLPHWPPVSERQLQKH